MIATVSERKLASRNRDCREWNLKDIWNSDKRYNETSSTVKLSDFILKYELRNTTING